MILSLQDLMWYKKGSIGWNPEIEWMSTVTGARASVHGRGRLMLEIGDLQVHVVADIKDEFLTPNRYVVDVKNWVLSVNDDQSPLL